jgi:ornithine cyclodeaminase/alanine dehydrogenase-like protein (mu-crystallin family)
MKLIDADTANRLLDYPSLVEALRQAHRHGTQPKSVVTVLGEPPDEVNKFVSLVAWAPGDVIAVKLVGVFPGNATLRPPQPSVQGLVCVFDAGTGTPLLAADGAALTFRKTAADSALGVDLLARRDARTLLVVGAGGLAPHVAMAHTSQRPGIDRILIWNRNAGRAQALADTLHLPGVTLEAVEDLDEALPQADIVSCVTMSEAPLVKGALLKPGTHVDLIGSYLPAMRECDDDTMRRGQVFVDTRNGMENNGDLGQPVARGALRWADIQADLYDLCSGRHPGRRNDQDITVFKNVGGAHLDMYTARLLSERARS